MEELQNEFNNLLKSNINLTLYNTNKCHRASSNMKYSERKLCN